MKQQNIFEGKLAWTQDLKDVIESAMSAKPKREECSLSLICKVTTSYDESGFTELQKFLFMSKVVIITQEVWHVMVLNFLKPILNLAGKFHGCDEFERRFPCDDNGFSLR